MKLTSSRVLAPLCPCTSPPVLHSSVSDTEGPDKTFAESNVSKCLQAIYLQMLTGKHTNTPQKHTREHAFVCTQTNWLKRRVCPHISVGNRTALWAHCSADLAAPGSGVEILSGHMGGESLHFALNPNLHIKVNSVRNQLKIWSQNHVTALRTQTCLFNGSQ